MASLPSKRVRKSRASKGGKARWAIYHAELAKQGITPEEMRRRNNLERVRRFKANAKKKKRAKVT